MKTPIALGALALITGLLLAGCGGGGGDSSTPTAPTSPSHSSQGKGSTGSKDGGLAQTGDQSVQAFGSEAKGADRAAPIATFHGYLTAIADHDTARACSYLSASVQQSLRRLVVPQLRAKGCPAILPKILSATAAPIGRQQAGGEVTRVRVKGDRAFVLYHAPGARLYAMTMMREGGAWKATMIAGTVLIPSPAAIGAAP